MTTEATIQAIALELARYRLHDTDCFLRPENIVEQRDLTLAVRLIELAHQLNGKEPPCEGQDQ